MADFGTTIALGGPFDEAIERVTAALAQEGFGIISRIDLDKAFAEKLGQSFRRYTILGACNPGLAHRAVTARPDVGLLLPCNVTVEEGPDGALVRLVDAGQMMAMGDLGEAPEIAELAEDAGARLGRVAAALQGQ
ncbi:DUF302 domain-containing protein [Pseudooceanicola sp. HF7]|uniref:DUF302 domain-containing protein n=1 Tax=Pseudooceanicola sp. HF7 TaxID=2721560 RepID=UPI0014309490|nr:DUF302 domain-containing protein [Pseudooceanicola sp. HF7]NIZ09784.1 DUF302 domain-containing protein [Pseudooceanicola sp. HF7]